MVKNDTRYHKIREVGKISKEDFVNRIVHFLGQNPDNKLSTESEFKEFVLHLQQDGITPGQLSEEAKEVFLNKLATTTPGHLNNKRKSFIEKFQK